jgi:hypothetical protein
MYDKPEVFVMNRIIFKSKFFISCNFQSFKRRKCASVQQIMLSAYNTDRDEDQDVDESWDTDEDQYVHRFGTR